MIGDCDEFPAIRDLEGAEDFAPCEVRNCTYRARLGVHSRRGIRVKVYCERHRNTAVNFLRRLETGT